MKLENMARRLAGMRKSFKGGRPRSCNCGKCDKCKATLAQREYRARASERAKKRREASGA